MTSSLLSIEELYKKVNLLLVDNLTLFQGLTLTDISIDRELKLEGYKYFFCSGTNKKNEKNLSINLQIPATLIQEYFKDLSKEDKERKGIKFDLVIQELSIQEYSGKITIIPSKIKETGVSERELLRRRLHKYCQDKNYYARTKQLLPRVVTSILAITSKSSEIKDDLLSNLNIPSHKVHIVYCSTSDEIASQINHADIKQFDIIVLFRGGREDEAMGIFSHESIIDAIVKSKIPVCAALGHELDQPFICTIADKEHSTPSAFAKAIKEHNENVEKDYKIQMNSFKVLFDLLRNKFNVTCEQLNSATEAASKQIYEKSKGFIGITSASIDGQIEIIISNIAQKAEKVHTRIQTTFKQIIEFKNHKIDECSHTIGAAIRHVFLKRVNAIDSTTQNINANLTMINSQFSQRIDIANQEIQFSMDKIALLNHQRIDTALSSIDYSSKDCLGRSIELTEKMLTKIETLYEAIVQKKQHQQLMASELASKRKMKLIIFVLLGIIVLIGTLFLLSLKI